MTNKELETIEQLTEVAIKMAELRAENKTLKEINEKLIQSLQIKDVSGLLEFKEGYEEGYSDATREACQEIAKNYQPNDR
jgi:hypothetical protein